MGTCTRQGNTYKRHVYKEGSTCKKCGHKRPEKNKDAR